MFAGVKAFQLYTDSLDLLKQLIYNFYTPQKYVVLTQLGSSW